MLPEDQNITEGWQVHLRCGQEGLADLKRMHNTNEQGVQAAFVQRVSALLQDLKYQRPGLRSVLLGGGNARLLNAEQLTSDTGLLARLFTPFGLGLLGWLATIRTFYERNNCR